MLDRKADVDIYHTHLQSKWLMFNAKFSSADSIYGFLGAFNEVYSECTDAEKKQFMQAFIERIDIFPERREDGNLVKYAAKKRRQHHKMTQ